MSLAKGMFHFFQADSWCRTPGYAYWSRLESLDKITWVQKIPMHSDAVGGRLGQFCVDDVKLLPKSDQNLSRLPVPTFTGIISGPPGANTKVQAGVVMLLQSCHADSFQATGPRGVHCHPLRRWPSFERCMRERWWVTVKRIWRHCLHTWRR